MPMGSYGTGKVRELGSAIWAGLIDAFPDLHITVQSMFGDESNIAAEVVIGGTQRKDLDYGEVRIPSHGEHYELPHVFLLQPEFAVHRHTREISSLYQRLAHGPSGPGRTARVPRPKTNRTS